MKRRQIISLSITAISFISLIVFLSLLLGEHFQVESCGCPKMVSQNFIILFVILSILFIGSLIYYLLSIKLEEKNQKVRFNINTIMKFLDDNEKKILNQLGDKEIFQSSIKGLPKVKKHRAIKKLEEKGIILVTKEKNKNKLQLNKNFKLE
jgi:uncharacterized membrane protein